MFYLSSGVLKMILNHYLTFQMIIFRQDYIVKCKNLQYALYNHRAAGSLGVLCICTRFRLEPRLCRS